MSEDLLAALRSAQENEGDFEEIQFEKISDGASKQKIPPSPLSALQSQLPDDDWERASSSPVQSQQPMVQTGGLEIDPDEDEIDNFIESQNVDRVQKRSNQEVTLSLNSDPDDEDYNRRPAREPASNRVQKRRQLDIEESPPPRRAKESWDADEFESEYGNSGGYSEDDEYYDEPKRNRGRGNQGSDAGPQNKLIGNIIKVAIFVVIVFVVFYFASSKLKPKIDDTTTNQNTQSTDTSGTTSDNDTATGSDNSNSSNEDSSASQTTQTPTSTNAGNNATVARQGVQITNQELKFDPTLYKDNMAVNKFIELKDGALTPMFVGYATHLGKNIQFEVTLEDYNKYVNGVEITITYVAVMVDGIQYVTNISIAQ